MSTVKQQLLLQLEEKKIQLKQLQDKCELQNKKIKLFRKQNEQLTSMIQERNQLDTNLLLNSKQLLSLNSKLQKSIEQVQQQLEIARKNKSLQDSKSRNHSQGSSDRNNNQSLAQQSFKKKLLNSVITLKDVTITQTTLQVDIPHAELNDDDFTQLENFGQLKAIIVNDNLLGNPSIEMICGSFSQLQKLNLANNKFEAKSLQNIKNLQNLKVLDIRNNNLGDQAMKFISSLSNLTQLSCSKNAITDQGAQNLQSLKNMTYLDITNNLITSSGCNSLSKLQKLTHLYLMSNRLSKDGILLLMKNSSSLQFLDVRFNLWANQDKDQVKANKTQNLQVFC